ncbi:MAG: DotU family type IV/VI secretion system protein [Nannocystaceae bacterium]
MSDRRDTWRAILDARADVDRMVAAAVGDYPDQIPVRPSEQGGTQPYGGASDAVPFQEATWQPDLADGGTTQVTPRPTAGDAEDAAARQINDQELATLRDLQRRVVQRLDALAVALSRELGRDDAMKALSIDFDERILDRLPDFMRPSWPLVQTSRTGSITGGEDFYYAIDYLRATAGTASFVFEVYYFCLNNGFVGRYANDLDSIEEYRQRLRESITVPRAPSDGNDTAEVRIDVVKPRSAWVAYAVSLGVVVVFAASLTALSNL